MGKSKKSLADEERADKIADALRRKDKNVPWADIVFLGRYIEKHKTWRGVNLPNGLERAQDIMKRGKNGS